MADTAGENIIIFKTPDDDWGEFSNQYPAPFTYMGIRFESVEQFLYYMKAIFGRSKVTAEKILDCGADSSALSKASKKQRVLEHNTWDAVRPQIMRLGMRQKFLQNPELRKKLLSTGFRLLVEITKEGLLGRLIPANEDWVRDPAKWKGKNQTGRVLMQVRADLRCADRLVEADEAYVFPKDFFVLRTPIGQMTLQEISALPGARESVRAYAATAQQFLQMVVSSPDDFINRSKIPLVTMERAIARNAADIEFALNRAKSRAAAGENATDANAASMMEAGGDIDANAALTPELEFGTDTDIETAAAFDTATETRSADPDEKLPDDIPGEGFYELLCDLDEMMKLGII